MNISIELYKLEVKRKLDFSKQLIVNCKHTKGSIAMLIKARNICDKLNINIKCL